MESPKNWQRAELLIFSIVTILNMVPFVSTRFFPSMDGASHLVNSNIINQLFFHNNTLFHQFFMINPEPVPNWTAHLLISLLTLIMPAFLAEKILLIILLGGIPLVFRAVIHTISPKDTIYSFLVFPFTHSMFLFFGFFNFSIGILFFLVTLNFWLHHYKTAFTVHNTLILTLLVAATYFSHIVIFGILLIVIALHIKTKAASDLLCRKERPRVVLLKFVRKDAALTIASIIPIALFAWFFYTRPGTREIRFIPRGELLGYLATIRPLISLNPVEEGRYTSLLFYLFVLVFMAGMITLAVRRLQHKRQRQCTIGTESQHHAGFEPWWLLASILLLSLLYFFLPDAYGTASYTSLRISLFMFLLVILLFSTLRTQWYIGLAAAVVGLGLNFMLIRYYKPHIDELSKLAATCNKAAEQVAPNSIVLPIYCMDNWFTGHFVDYLAVDKPLVMVYNYECESGYFPVIWNKATKPNYFLGNPATPEQFINFELSPGNTTMPLDYVWVLGTYDPGKDWFFSTLDRILSSGFEPVFKEGSCTLYRNRLSERRDHE